MKTLRTSRRLVPFALVALALVFTNGCFDDRAATGPDPEAAPTLPAPESLTFDFGFFQEPSGLERASRDHFFNAYIRAAIVGAVTELVLVPPVAAFSLALHTVPSPQDDGSWLWVYTWVHGPEEAQVRLRGLALSDGRVQWQMRVSSTLDDYDRALWFEGETWNDGDSGDWTFHALDVAGEPAVALLQWGGDADGRYLRFVDIAGNVDDTLEFRENGPEHSFTFTDASDPELGWYIRWNEGDGTGSLRAPDYNGGEPACWDEYQRDAECPGTPAL